MSDIDPFADLAFLTRLQKLLPLLASEQPGEADAARRKLLEHLNHHRMSLSDVSSRLGSAGPRASFLQGAREISLERQLQIAREAKHEAQTEAAMATSRVHELQSVLQGARFEAGAALLRRRQVRAWAISGWAVAGLALVLAVLPRIPADVWRFGSPNAQVQEGPVRVEASGQANPYATPALAPGERMGTTLVQDLAIRLQPTNEAGVRAFLNRGTRIVIAQEVRVGQQTWLLVRTASGSGWVRGGDVLH